jgi:hypothetical protein
MLLEAKKCPKTIHQIDKNYLIEGLDQKTFQEKSRVRLINVVFQFKLYFMITIIIITQKWTYLCLILMFAL